MITNEQLNKFSPDERSTWIDLLSADEKAILHCTMGHRYTLVFVSLVKKHLAEDIPAYYRLKYLQWLEIRDEACFSPEVIAAVEPMCDDGYELLRETMKLGAKKGFDMIASWEVFSAFVALNPSLLAALQQSPCYQWKRSA
jgi:hypothetical protein